MTSEISKVLLGKMLSKYSTEQVIEDVAVLFHEWLDEGFLSTDDACQKLQCADTAELYRYWIDNIYKPE